MDDIPETRIEQVAMMEGILTSRATGGSPDGHAYEYLRREVLADGELKPMLPEFVRTCRDLGAFWSHIKPRLDRYEERRTYIRDAFAPVMDHLEGRNRAPGDAVVGDALASFDADGVHAVWAKALARRTADPEGAITVARTLLEAVCKHILDGLGIAYAPKDDLPKLYGAVARGLKLAPDQHREEPIRAILGGAMNLVNGLGTLRNRFSDAHADDPPTEERPRVRPSPRHASLAVNAAGAIATFLVETYQERSRG
ncbi:abortive phage resistance protein [Methylobacterium sp. Leaf465]|jgi:DNA-binding transcriptional LysR family regulator|uniref:abortive infection family protein n=1 Tax=Methylobacterium sp. Leaf465 TaxID=1736385 RepID=UPI0006F4B741|nr:abortive infection family protein [Methylobacterium sp. Leaf465]KQT83702.1 abortive phage resistance protein [Methylobacterium sp. Leaf465]